VLVGMGWNPGLVSPGGEGKLGVLKLKSPGQAAPERSHRGQVGRGSQGGGQAVAHASLFSETREAGGLPTAQPSKAPRAALDGNRLVQAKGTGARQ